MFCQASALGLGCSSGRSYARLLVDLPLSLAGMEEAARAKAILDVDELNRYYQSSKRPPYCLGASVFKPKV